MRIGLLFMGNENSTIWGSAITTYYLAEALHSLGHETWRLSMGAEKTDWDKALEQRTQLVIAEGINANDIPPALWDRCDYVVLWWLSTLFYDQTGILNTPYHGIASNSAQWTAQLKSRNLIAHTIELAAPVSFADAEPHPDYRSTTTYLGAYPLKAEAQMDLMFLPAAEHGLTIWGYGWAESPYRQWYRGPLPLLDIARLYKSVDVVLALTQHKQRDLGMINNRIFEALAAGAILISDRHPALEAHELGPFINFVDTSDQVRALLKSLPHAPVLRERARAGQKVVLANHTYRHRATEFLKLYDMLLTNAPSR